MTNPLVWYIHGAHATPRSFTYLKTAFPDHAFEDIAYSCAVPVRDTVEALTSRVPAGRPLRIVAHSLGGVVAATLAGRDGVEVERIATIGTPFGGHKAAALARWIMPGALLNDLCPHSPLLAALHRAPFAVPTLSVVSTGGGSPFLREPGDGVVTVASQKALAGPTYVDVPLNHFETLLSAEVAAHVRGFIFGTP